MGIPNVALNQGAEFHKKHANQIKRETQDAAREFGKSGRDTHELGMIVDALKEGLALAERELKHKLETPREFQFRSTFKTLNAAYLREDRTKDGTWYLGTYDVNGADKGNVAVDLVKIRQALDEIRRSAQKPQPFADPY